MPRPQVLLDHVVELLPQRIHLRLLGRLGEVERVELLVAEVVGDVGHEALPRGVAAAGSRPPPRPPPPGAKPPPSPSRGGRAAPAAHNAGRSSEKLSHPPPPPLSITTP